MHNSQRSIFSSFSFSAALVSCAFILPGTVLAAEAAAKPVSETIDNAPERTPFVKALDRLNKRFAERPEGGHERDAWDKAFVDSLPLINIPPEATTLSDFTTQWQSPVFVNNSVVSFIMHEIASPEEKAQFTSADSLTRAYQMLWNVDTGELKRVVYLGLSHVGEPEPCADTVMPGVIGFADYSAMPQDMQDIMAEDKKLLKPEQGPDYRAFYFHFVEGEDAGKTYFVLARNAWGPEIVDIVKRHGFKDPAKRIGNVLATDYPKLKDKLDFAPPGQVIPGPARYWHAPSIVGEILSGTPFDCRKWSQFPTLLAHWNLKVSGKAADLFSTINKTPIRVGVETTFVDRHTNEVVFSIPLTRMDHMPLGVPDDKLSIFSVWYDSSKDRYFLGDSIEYSKIDRRFYWVYRQGWRVQEVSVPGNFASTTPTKYGVLGSVPGARVHLRDNGVLEHWRLDLPYDKELAAKINIKPEYYSTINPSPNLCRGVGIWPKYYTVGKYHLSPVQNADYQLFVINYCSDIFENLMGK
ncbi:hypothetical protein [Sneathiella sp.]|uniref:hypothetical protein n=1 Tax=Sneathiella sp. TaxID=1964365 RepID=UPI002FE3378E